MKIHNIILLSILTITLFSCKKDDEEIVAALPIITTIDPTSVAVGSPVIINGSNFSTDLSGNKVRFFQESASVNGTITKAARNSIYTSVPANLTPGEYFVEVTVEGQSAISADKLIVTANGSSAGPVTVSSFAPTSGERGAIITIQGSNFSLKPGETSVLFSSTGGSYEGTVREVTASAIHVEVPANITLGEFNVNIRVGTKYINAKENFTVTATLLPSSIWSSSSSVSQGGTFTINGINFGGSAEGYQVSFISGSTANGLVINAKSNSITVVAPTSAPGDYTLKIYKYGELVNTSIKITLVSAPFTFTGFSETGGSGGITLSLAGNGFSSTLANNKIELLQGDKAVEVPVMKASSTALDVYVPNSVNAGKYYIRITISGQSVTLFNPFTAQ